MKLSKLFKRKPDIATLTQRRDFLLQSPIFRNQQQMSTKTAKRMIEKLFEN